MHRSLFLFYILHYDLASLFAGKIHTVLFRPYSKCRDWYDLLWYLTSAPRIEPNLEMLDNALAQSGWTGPKPTPENWKGFLKSAAEAMDEKRVQDDVRRLLEDPAEADLLTRSGFLSLLG
ncbi:MAG: nucleotidyl transferase AbiEii/AbiGii toxin family protein [Acidobacteriota bacterium]|nr:nucleotidyl transferase AbiEii/AbiGii toxin family protein [Acidobacteriota bacterium]